MKHASEMSSDTMTYIPSFIKIGSGVQKLLWRGTYTDSNVTSYDYFVKIREVGKKKNEVGKGRWRRMRKGSKKQ
jgi:hypothetical protein